MLIDKGISTGSTVTLKLTSGEEVIAKYHGESADNYRVSRPMTLSINPQGLGMMPFAFTVNRDKEIYINKLSVIMISVTEKQFSDQYIQSTTGITMP